MGECWVCVIFFAWSLTPWYGFLAHGFLILDLELGFQRSVKTLYCIVKTFVSEVSKDLKETKRVVKL